MKNIKEGKIITCPHCKGKRGNIQLLYYWVKCYLCEGVGKIMINKILKVDKKNGDVRCKFTINKNNGNCPNLVTKTDWLI